jgi:hypothetical protein
MTLDREDIAAIAAEVVRQLGPALTAKLVAPDPEAEKAFNSKVPLKLREAAEICHVEYVWLRDRVARKEIKAYRSGPAGSWRVFPADVRALVMSESNQQPARRKSVLRKVA